MGLHGEQCVSGIMKEWTAILNWQRWLTHRKQHIAGRLNLGRNREHCSALWLPPGNTHLALPKLLTFLSYSRSLYFYVEFLLFYIMAANSKLFSKVQLWKNLVLGLSFLLLKYTLNTQLVVSKMVWWIEALVTRPTDLSSIPEIHKEERDRQSLQAVILLSHCTVRYVQSHMYTHK